jgi:hypothetical protein
LTDRQRAVVQAAGLFAMHAAAPPAGANSHDPVPDLPPLPVNPVNPVNPMSPLNPLNVLNVLDPLDPLNLPVNALNPLNPANVLSGNASHFGTNPASPAFGGQVFNADVDPSQSFSGLDVSAHSSYWDPNSWSLINMAHIVDGQYSKVLLQ